MWEPADPATKHRQERTPMGLNVPKKNTGGDPPEVEPGLTLLRFDALVQKSHPDWAGVDGFGKDDDGERFHFQVTVLDSDRKPLYGEDGDPIGIEAMTSTSTG